ncbi:MAG TPA: type II secretion system protein [Candidatus Paceibacterota bacterium]
MNAKAASVEVRGARKKTRARFLHCLEPRTSNLNAGFTLVEMIVAVALFAIVMVVAVAALLSLTAANRKAQAIQSVMNNLNITLDGMVRNIRMGVDYDGSGDCSSNKGGGPNDCTSGGSTFEFTCNPATAVCSPTQSTWTYSACGSAICKNGSEVTAPDVTIDDILFYVVGTNSGDTGNTIQPKVVIVIKGTAGAQNVRTRSEFHIQATAVQRELDL